MNLIPWRAILLTALFVGTGGFLGGHHVAAEAGKVALLAQEKASEAAIDSVQKQAADAKAAAEKAAADKAAADQKAGEAIAAQAAAEARVRSLAYTNVRKGIYRVEQNLASLGVPTHVMSAGWVRQ